MLYTTKCPINTKNKINNNNKSGHLDVLLEIHNLELQIYNL